MHTRRSVLKNRVVRNLRFLLLLLTARRGLIGPRAVALAAIAAFFVYLRSPYQLIPQRIPIFGYADNVGILVLGFLLARWLTPTALYDFDGWSRRRTGRGAVALRIGYMPPLRAARRGAAAAGTGSNGTDRPGPQWSLYDMLGYRRAWQLRALIRWQAVSSSAPIVIGGCGRSGTTLLRTILNRHPDVFCGDESTVFLRRISSPRDIARRYGLTTDQVAAMLREAPSQIEFIERFERECLRLSGKRVWAEKTPDNVMRFDFVRRHFPRARIVHVIRDGRDVVCSLRRQKWFKVPEERRASLDAVEFGIDYWMRRVAAGLEFRGDPRYYELRYEDLVIHPEETLRALFESLGLDWVESVVVPPVMPVMLERHERVIDRDALGQWRRDLSALETALIEKKAGRLLTELGYRD